MSKSSMGQIMNHTDDIILLCLCISVLGSLMVALINLHD